MDDNFAFIENLLDTLQGEEDAEGRAASKASLDDILDAADLTREPPESQHAGNSSDRPPAIDQETLDAMLNRFCEDGDESIVDTLLDSFLKGQGDVGNMIDEIDKRARTGALAAPTSKSLHLDLEQLHGDDFGSPCLESWEALISSARGLLNSARSSYSQYSARSPGLPVDSMQATAATGSGWVPPGKSIEGKCNEDDLDTSGSERRDCKELPEHQSRGASGDGAITVDTSKAEILAKLASTESPQAVRNFMKSFLLGVRQRYISEYMRDVKPEAHGNAADDDSECDSSTSCWTCRSVSNVNSDPDD
eukprot:TRINITY_DN81477_c0_g1_i1.p1 TRINITY_DN81477_c0_g1~~TRINITY_DN81477_c0_g1_i1.p1  ORF type:complete len:307 (-),score=84.09 TRINITY_DN81477_c0_g1_i1:90-1010(-)